MYHTSRLPLFGLILFFAFGAWLLPSQAQRSSQVTTSSSTSAPSKRPTQIGIRPEWLQNAADGPFEAGAGVGGHLSSQAVDASSDQASAVNRGATDDRSSAGGGFAAAGEPHIQAGLTITPTFDSSITGNANAAAIQTMINNAIGAIQSLFSDSITVNILFRYTTTEVDGTTPLPAGLLARSNFVIYNIAWNTYTAALIADAKTANDASANASLPAMALTTNIVPSSAGGRAIGLATPGVMKSDGTVPGGSFDGIITINSAQPFQFTRPVSSGNFDAQRSTEHEIDEVLGLGSYLPNGTNLRPQDLFSWSAPGTRNVSSSGSRFFSIDGGVTNIVGFNQNSNGDFGDWLSGTCPQLTPYVQNAFSCAGQMADVLPNSPEGINLDVIGYDLAQTATCTLICPNITQPNDDNQCSAVVNFSPTTTGTCGTVTCSPASGSTFPVGTTTVTCDSTTLQSCSFTVTVTDTTPPVITCPADKQLQCGDSTDPSNTGNATATDNCGAVTISHTDAATAPNCTGHAGIDRTWKATDGSGNMATCVQHITFIDTTPPVITCPGNFSTAVAASCPIAISRPVSFTVTATDNCGGTPTVVCNPPAGSTFPVGTTTVNCTATDGCGNVSSCSFMVTVFSFCLQDETNPGNFVLIDATTGNYNFFCNGVLIASGTGTLTVKGCEGSILHVKGDRRVYMEWDTSAFGVGAGTAIVQVGPNNTRCQITDKNMSNNTCTGTLQVVSPVERKPKKGQSQN